MAVTAERAHHASTFAAADDELAVKARQERLTLYLVQQSQLVTDPAAAATSTANTAQSTTPSVISDTDLASASGHVVHWHSNGRCSSQSTAADTASQQVGIGVTARMHGYDDVDIDSSASRDRQDKKSFRTGCLRAQLKLAPQFERTPAPTPPQPTFVDGTSVLNVAQPLADVRAAVQHNRAAERRARAQFTATLTTTAKTKAATCGKKTTERGKRTVKKAKVEVPQASVQEFLAPQTKAKTANEKRVSIPKRLTSCGIYNKGRRSEKAVAVGVPDLAFSETRFLPPAPAPAPELPVAHEASAPATPEPATAEPPSTTAVPSSSYFAPSKVEVAENPKSDVPETAEQAVQTSNTPPPAAETYVDSPRKSHSRLHNHRRQSSTPRQAAKVDSDSVISISRLLERVHDAIDGPSYTEQSETPTQADAHQLLDEYALRQLHHLPPPQEAYYPTSYPPPAYTPPSLLPIPMHDPRPVTDDLFLQQYLHVAPEYHNGYYPPPELISPLPYALGDDDDDDDSDLSMDLNDADLHEPAATVCDWHPRAIPTVPPTPYMPGLQPHNQSLSVDFAYRAHRLH
ncbi:hypothetical protein RI367_007040 [Sorochytrium milnesiophthora]